MQISDTDLASYLRHRAGDEEITKRTGRLRQKALELNSPGVDYASTFGDSEFPAYVGFLDLAGFSEATHGKRPKEIAAFLRPFLSQVLDVFRSHGILIDKTIGDEVMFVLPDCEEESDNLELLSLGEAMGALHDLAFNLEPHYRYRIGLAYGDVSFVHVEGTGYSEWTCVGETVHVAKRLHELKYMKDPDPVSAAFGMLVNEVNTEEIRATMKHRLDFFAGVASRFSHERLNCAQDFKGVGNVLCAHLLPHRDRVQPHPRP